MIVELNIGLEGPGMTVDGRERAVVKWVHSVVKPVQGRKPTAEYILVNPPGEEPTIVVRMETNQDIAFWEDLLYVLSHEWGQDCIAARFTPTGGGEPIGKLCGPRAHMWGAFDPDRFHALPTPAPSDVPPELRAGAFITFYTATGTGERQVLTGTVMGTRSCAPSEGGVMLRVVYGSGFETHAVSVPATSVIKVTGGITAATV